MPEELLRTITVGPLSIFFTNVNKAMGIPGHSHFAEVKIVFQTLGPIGFPVFEETVDLIKALLKRETAGVFRDSTNEDVESRLWAALDTFVEERDNEPILKKWGGEYMLLAIEVAIRGVPDKIGHSDGFARYTIQRQPK
jgi:hypothetical protein